MTAHEQLYLIIWCVATLLMVASKPLEEKLRPNGMLRKDRIHSWSALSLGCSAMLWPYLLIIVGVRPPRELHWWFIGVSLSGVISLAGILYWHRRYNAELARWILAKQSTDFLLRACVQAVWWWLVWH